MKPNKEVLARLAKDRRWYKEHGYYIVLMNVKKANEDSLNWHYSHHSKHYRLMKKYEEEHKDERNRYKRDWDRLNRKYKKKG